MKFKPQTNSLIESVARSSSADAVLGEFGAFGRAVASSALLARTLAQADLADRAKAAFVGDVVKGAFKRETVDLIVAVAGESTSSSDVPRVFFDALTELAFVHAEASGGLQGLEQQLLDMADIVSGSEELRDALANPGVSDDAKVNVLGDLLGTRTPKGLREVSLTAISVTHGRGVDSLLRSLAETAAARRGASIAVVSSAVELDAARKERLLSALSHTAGRKIEGRFVVDPQVIGSLVVRIGDEVLDGSVRHRLHQARAALVGAR